MAKSNSILKADPTDPPSVVERSVTAATAHADALAAQAKQAAEADLHATLALLSFPELDATAERLITATTACELDATEALARTMIDAKSRRTILTHRPGLEPLFLAVDREANDLRALVFDQPETLRRARSAYAALTPADLIPQPGRDVWTPTAFGLVNSKLWRLRNDLGNVRPVVAVATALGQLDTAWQALSDALAAPVDVRPQPAQVMAMSPRRDDAESGRSVTAFNPFDSPKR